ncbi:hypothetical protein Tco_1234337 [Tanacetum coccineum]
MYQNMIREESTVEVTAPPLEDIAKKSKTCGSSSFNTKYGDASFNLNVDAEDENEAQEIPRTMGKDKARGSKKKGAGSFGSSKEERAAYMEIKRRKVELRERELEMEAYMQRQEDMRFYMQPYDHLTEDQLAHMEAMRAEIKAKYNLRY